MAEQAGGDPQLSLASLGLDLRASSARMQSIFMSVTLLHLHIYIYIHKVCTVLLLLLSVGARGSKK